MKAPSDIARAIAKLLAKLDEEDKDTLNWIIEARNTATTFSRDAVLEEAAIKVEWALRKFYPHGDNMGIMLRLMKSEESK